jgi:hypothetical protein
MRIEKPHVHGCVTEIYLVAQGAAEMRVEQETFVLEAGLDGRGGPCRERAGAPLAPGVVMPKVYIGEMQRAPGDPV